MAARLTLPLLGAALLGTTACASSCYMGISMIPGESAPEVQAFAQRARAGDKHAQLDLSIRFEEGNDVQQDQARAIKLYRQAAGDSGGTQMMYVPHKGYVQAIPVNAGPRIAGLTEAKRREIVENRENLPNKPVSIRQQLSACEKKYKNRIQKMPGLLIINFEGSVFLISKK